MYISYLLKHECKAIQCLHWSKPPAPVSSSQVFNGTESSQYIVAKLISLISTKPKGILCNFDNFSKFETRSQLSSSGSARLLVTVQSKILLLLAAT